MDSSRSGGSADGLTFASADDWKRAAEWFLCALVLGSGCAGFLHPHAHALRLSMIRTWIYFISLRFRGTYFARGAEPAGTAVGRGGARITACCSGSHISTSISVIARRTSTALCFAGKRCRIFYGRRAPATAVPASAITHASVDPSGRSALARCGAI